MSDNEGFAGFQAIIAEDTAAQADSETEAEAQAPPDGALLEDADTDAESDGDDLSDEERVAESLRHDLEESGVTLEEPESDEDEDEVDVTAAGDDDEETAEESDEDIEALIEEGRRARAARLADESNQPLQEIYSRAEQRIQYAKQHYANERRKARAHVQREAQKAQDPDAFFNAHIDATIDGVIAAEEAWIAGIGNETQQAVMNLRVEQSIPDWANHLVEEHNLPAKAKDVLMDVYKKTKNPNLMAERAEEMVAYRNAMKADRKKTREKVKAELAKGVKANQVHPGASGRPATGKPPQLKGNMKELDAILNL
jgi:hypothetical protein